MNNSSKHEEEKVREMELELFRSKEAVEMNNRRCAQLKEEVLRLKEDLSIANERDARAQRRISELTKEFEKKEREMKAMFVKLRDENQESERAKKSAEDQLMHWKRKCYEMEAKLRIIHQNLLLTEKRNEEIVPPSEKIENPQSPKPTAIDVVQDSWNKEVTRKRHSTAEAKCTQQGKRQLDVSVSKCTVGDVVEDKVKIGQQVSKRDSPSPTSLKQQRNGQENVVNVWRDEEDLHDSLSEDPELCMKAICALYRQQLSSNKKRRFIPCDVFKATTIARFLMNDDPCGPIKKTVEELKKYDPNGVDYCCELARAYCHQIFLIYQNKEDPFFPKS